MSEPTSHLRPDGTVFPPVTPDPPFPPGYVDPLPEEKGGQFDDDGSAAPVRGPVPEDDDA